MTLIYTKQAMSALLEASRTLRSSADRWPTWDGLSSALASIENHPALYSANAVELWPENSAISTNRYFLVILEIPAPAPNIKIEFSLSSVDDDQTIQRIVWV